MKPIINFYEANMLEEIQDVRGLYIVKVVTDKIGETLYYKLYRCADPLTPGAYIQVDDLGVPEGDRIYGTEEELNSICQALFPIIIALGGIPDR